MIEGMLLALEITAIIFASISICSAFIAIGFAVKAMRQLRLK